MIPTRYLGPVHAIGLTLREEGLRGLYRGYTAYILATAIYLMIVPMVAELNMHKAAISGSKVDEFDELYSDVKKGGYRG